MSATTNKKPSLTSKIYQSIIEGKLSPRILGLVVEWAALYQTELMQNWQLAKLQAPLEPINPLE